MKGKIIFGLIILLTLSFLIIYGILSFGYSKGVRSGKLVKLSKKGFLIKTYEGTLDLGSGDALTWEFSIHDDDLGDKLIIHSGTTVRLKYEEKLYPLYYGTKYEVVSFELVREKGPDNLCTLVHIIKNDPELVDRVRDLVLERNPSFIDDIRACF
jgi:hypothetical protein